ncbi:Zinc finger CCCH domain-containing protein 63 [Nymphaea thermarum]|nr:Zinc finger CCCH domain-containing protein 63 [Nymphaea thermarum]
MDVEFADKGGNKRTYHRVGATGKIPKICYYWQEGRCTRNPCNFLHGEVPGGVDRVGTSNGVNATKRPNQMMEFENGGGPPMQRRPVNPKWGRNTGGSSGAVVESNRRLQGKVCNFWISGHCKYGNDCKFLHSFFVGEGFTLVTALTGHEKAVRGIALPSGSDKLYSGSADASVRVWDCQSGQCAGAIKLPGEVGCLISEGPWLFVGIPNFVKAWNTQTAAELTLNGPNGQVHALAVGNEMLLAGIQDGSILAWKFSIAANCFEPAASLLGHTLSVVSLVFGANRLFSGSMDKTIKIWNLETFQCIQTLGDHSSVVMSLLCWKDFLLSCSLDQTVKVWVATENGDLKVTYTHKEEHGVLALCGTLDAQDQPVLISACNDNSVRLYDLPSFNERGKMYSKEEVRAIQVAPGGLFFTGDGTGELRVWKWLAQGTKA